MESDVFKFSDVHTIAVELKYMQYKFQYKKAKFERKLRLTSDCDKTCQNMVNYVQAFLKSGEAEAWWKFAIKAAYIKIFNFAVSMEFAAS